MRSPAVWGLAGALLAAGGPAFAEGKAEAGAAARNANCTPSKTDVVRYVPGAEGETVYKVTCTENKGAFIIVQCRGQLCSVLRSPNEFSIR